MQYNHLIYFFSRKELIKIANYLLFPAIMRVPTYVIGICFGCFLQHIDCKGKLDKVK